MFVCFQRWQIFRALGYGSGCQRRNKLIWSVWGAFGSPSSLQCVSVLINKLGQIEFFIPLDSGSNILSNGDDVVWLSPLSRLIFAVVSCSICRKLICFSAILLQWLIMIYIT